MISPTSWSVKGVYYEACNCDPVCPCRSIDGSPRQRATYGMCEFALSWSVVSGQYGPVRLDNFNVAMAGQWDTDSDKPWDIILYIDERADAAQKNALEQIFSGQAGGNILFAKGVASFREVKSARIELDHTENVQWFRVGNFAESKAHEPAVAGGLVTCGIPGHHITGQELVASHSVSDEDFQWEYVEQCGFTAKFEYKHDAA